MVILTETSSMRMFRLMNEMLIKQTAEVIALCDETLDVLQGISDDQKKNFLFMIEPI